MTRLSLAALMLVVLAGVTIGSVFIGAQDQPIDSPKPLDAATQLSIDKAVAQALADAEEGKPAPRRTAYVDFLSLLKEDRLLLAKQYEVAGEMQKATEEIRGRWEVKILAQKRIREQNKPHTKEYRDAMRAQLEAAKEEYQEELYCEQLYQEEMRKFGITRFKELRNLTRDLAKGRGYNEVLNIVRDIDKAGAGEDDFKALQQQLLVSPVLYFEAEHDITDLVKAEAKKIWDETISFVAYDKEKATGGIEFRLEMAEKESDGKPRYEAAPLKRNAEGEIEIKLGQKGMFRIDVLDKGVAAVGPRAGVRFSKRGLGVGEFSETGTYAAPGVLPVGGATFEVTVRSAIDPTVEQTVTIRLK